jgi:octaprenyl-diphosphate synthase
VISSFLAFSINALWKNKIAVLVGDFLLSKGLLLALNNNQFELLKIVSQAVQEMSEGELLQIEKARKLDITEDVYYQIIEQKTASLIASCCAVGTASVGAGKEQVGLMKKFGQMVGMAFQIKDDLFDYGNAKIGKPVGIDIREKKLTLPLIYSLNNTNGSARGRVLELIRKNNKKNTDIREIISFVYDNKGIQYAEEKMHEYHQEAKYLLAEIPNSTYKDSLLQLVRFTIDRQK